MLDLIEIIRAHPMHLAIAIGAAVYLSMAIATITSRWF